MVHDLPLPIGTRLEFIVPNKPPGDPGRYNDPDSYTQSAGIIVGYYDDDDGAGYEIVVPPNSQRWRVVYGSWRIIRLLP